MGGGLIQSGAYDAPSDSFKAHVVSERLKKRSGTVPVNFMTFGGRRFRSRGRPKRPHTRTSTLGNQFTAGRGAAPRFIDEEFLSAAEKTALWRRFKMFLNALANPSKSDYESETGSCPQNVYNAFSKALYEHSHLHLGHIAHYNRAGYCGNYFSSWDGIEEYMNNLGSYVQDYQSDYRGGAKYGDINLAMYKLWLPMKQKIKWAWMGK